MFVYIIFDIIIYVIHQKEDSLVILWQTPLKYIFLLPLTWKIFRASNDNIKRLLPSLFKSIIGNLVFFDVEQEWYKQILPKITIFEYVKYFCLHLTRHKKVWVWLYLLYNKNVMKLYFYSTGSLSTATFQDLPHVFLRQSLLAVTYTL